MSLTVLTYLVVGATFVLYIYIAWMSRVTDTHDFYVAGGGVHPIANGMATGADWMSAASFISMAGLISFLGYDGSVYLMGWTGGYCLLAMLLAPYLRKFGKFTVSEFIGERFYSNTARMVAVACLIVASITYVIGQMKGVGVVFSRSLGVSFEVGILLGMFIVFAYAVFGGMKGVTNTQIAQYCVLIFAYTVPAVFISLSLTGTPIPQFGLGSTMADGSGMYLLDKLDVMCVELGFAKYTAQKMSTTNMLFLTMSLMLGTAGLPHVIMRFFTVPTVKDARSSAGWALVFIACLYTTAPAIGAMGRMNLMQTIQTGEVGSPEGNIEYAKLPAWFKSWESTGLLKFEDKNGDGRIQYYDEKGLGEKAEEYGWKGNEMVKVDRDIMVLANPEIAQLPNWIIAVVTAGGVAAALSTAAGLLLAIATAISHDVLKGWLLPNCTDKQELGYSRWAIGGAIVVAGYLGLNPPGFAAQTVALAFGLAASSIFPALMMGIFSKRINNKGAVAGMLAGIGSTLLYIFIFKGFLFIKSTAIFPDNVDNWFFGLNPQSFGVVGAMFNFIVAYIVSLSTEEVPERVQQLIEDIRVPSKS